MDRRAEKASEGAVYLKFGPHPLKPCPICGGDGYRVVRGDTLTREEKERYNPNGERFARLPCWKCKGHGFLREP